MLKKILIKLILVVCLLVPALIANDKPEPTTTGKYDSPYGYWKTIDDKTNTAKSVMKLEEKEGKLYGRIVKLLKKDPKTLCKECPGERKNKPMLGMNILWGLSYDPDDEEWSGGFIMDPNTGNIYRTYVALKQDGNVLKVRGYIGFALLGRTQYWYRLNSPDEVQVDPRFRKENKKK